MNIKKKLGAVAVGSLLACTLAVPSLAFAADPTNGTTLDPNAIDEQQLDSNATNGAFKEKLAADQKADVTGYIKATNVKVTVPTKSAFNLNPWIDGSTDPTIQIENPTNFAISNYSPFPLFAKVSKVEVSTPSSAKVNTATLVSDTTGLTKNGDLLISLDSNVTGPSDYTNFNALTTASATAGYFTDAAKTGKIEKGEGEKETDGSFKTPTKLTMNFYGRAFDDGTAGWQAGDSFVLSPTFTISLKSFA